LEHATIALKGTDMDFIVLGKVGEETDVQRIFIVGNNMEYISICTLYKWKQGLYTNNDKDRLAMTRMGWVRMPKPSDIHT